MKKILVIAAVAATALVISASANGLKQCIQKLDQNMETAVIDFGKTYKDYGYNTKSSIIKACNSKISEIAGVNYGLNFKTKEGIEYKSSVSEFCSIWNNYMTHVSKKSESDKEYMKNFVYFNLARIDYIEEKNAKKQNAVTAALADKLETALNLSEKHAPKGSYLFSSNNFGYWIFSPYKSSVSIENNYTGNEYREFFALVLARDFEAADDIIKDHDRNEVESINKYNCYMRNR